MEGQNETVMAQQRVRTIVGEPMTPDLMTRIGGLTGFPPTPEDYQPDGNWVNTYRIHTCHGYFEDGNEDQGVLRIERVAGDSEDAFTLKFHHKIVNDEGRTNVVEAEARCNNDLLASLVEWKLTSEFVDLEGNPMAGLGSEEKGRATGTGVAITMGAHTLEHNTPWPVTADWCLFEAVQRMRFQQGSSPAFDFVEGLRLIREQHRLSYRGPYAMKRKGLPATMYWFHQIGSGVLPYEYWLDDRHRLLAVATHARAYVLDDGAEGPVRDRFDEIKQRKARRRNG